MSFKIKKKDIAIFEQDRNIQNYHTRYSSRIHCIELDINGTTNINTSTNPRKSFSIIFVVLLSHARTTLLSHLYATARQELYVTMCLTHIDPKCYDKSGKNKKYINNYLQLYKMI